MSRVGDGGSKHGKLAVEGLDVRSIAEEMSEGANLLDLALNNPDILSEEHALWQPRESDAEEAREDLLRTFRVALSNLTARQAQILDAMDIYGTQEKAAIALGISQQAVAGTIKDIEKKLTGLGCYLGKQGLKGKRTL